MRRKPAAARFTVHFPWFKCPWCHQLTDIQIRNPVVFADKVGGPSRGGRGYVKLADRVPRETPETV